jgi:hypothetical protein
MKIKIRKETPKTLFLKCSWFKFLIEFPKLFLFKSLKIQKFDLQKYSNFISIFQNSFWFFLISSIKTSQFKFEYLNQISNFQIWKVPIFCNWIYFESISISVLKYLKFWFESFFLESKFENLFYFPSSGPSHLSPSVPACLFPSLSFFLSWPRYIQPTRPLTAQHSLGRLRATVHGVVFV